MKKLAAEILPDPNHRPGGRGSPRNRVRRHMRKMLTAAGAATAAVQLCYCVVDMLPPPASCDTEGALPLSEALLLWASWENDTSVSDDSFVLINIEFDSSVLDATLSEAVEITNGTLLSVQSEEEGTTLVLEIAPEPGSNELLVTVTADCKGEAESVTFQIDVSDPSATGPIDNEQVQPTGE